MLAVVALLLVSQEPELEGLPHLTPGTPLLGEIEETDPSWSTAALVAAYGELGFTRGKSYLLRVRESGTYWIELRSLHCDTYLVLRSADGTVLLEDDDSAGGTNARIVLELNGNEPYRLDALALPGAVGSFFLRARAGDPRTLTASEVAEAAHEDALAAADALEESSGPGDPQFASQLEVLGSMLGEVSLLTAADSFLELALELRTEHLGAEDPSTLTALAILIESKHAQGLLEEEQSFLRRARSVAEGLQGEESIETGSGLLSIGGSLYERDECAAAAPFLERAPPILERHVGPDHHATVSAWEVLGYNHRCLGQHERARECFERVLASFERAAILSDPRAAGCWDSLAWTYAELGLIEEVIALHERRLSILEAELGSDHLDLAPALHHWARTLENMGRRGEAREALDRAFSIRVRGQGEEHPDVALVAERIAEIFQADGELGEALPWYRRAFSIRVRCQGEEHVDVAVVAERIGEIFRADGELGEALAWYRRAFSIRERGQGEEHPDVAMFAERIAERFRAEGELGEALPWYRRAVTIREKASAPDAHLWKLRVELARCLWDQGELEVAWQIRDDVFAWLDRPDAPQDLATAVVFERLGVWFGAFEFDTALACLVRAMEIHEAVLGPRHIEVGHDLADVAIMYGRLGRSDEQVEAHRKALAIEEENGGDPTVDLVNLSWALANQARFEEALRLLRRALTTARTKRGIVLAQTRIARTLGMQGKYDEAQQMYQETMGLALEVWGSHDSNTASLYENIGVLHAEQGEAVEALDRFRQSLALWKEVFGPSNPRVSRIMSYMAQIHLDQGDYAEARALLEDSLAMRAESGVPDHPDNASDQKHLARLLAILGDYDGAREGYERGLQTWIRAYGPDHPDTLAHVAELARFELDAGNRVRAAELARDALRRGRSRLMSRFASASESDALLYSARHKELIENVLAVATPEDGGALEAFDAILTWKGLVSRAYSRGGAVAPETRALLDQLRGVQARLSNLLTRRNVADAEQHARNLERLRQERDRVETELRRRGSFESEEQGASAARLAEALAPDQVWIDLLEHRPYRPARLRDGEVLEPGAWGDPVLTAWVLRSGGEPQRVELGPSARLQEAVTALLESTTRRRGLAAGGDGDPGRAANDELRELLWAPLAEHLEGVELVFLCPTAYLTTVPFGVIQDEDDRFLVEKYAFVHLRDGAALLELQSTHPRAAAPTFLAAGAIDYDEREEAPEGVEPSYSSGSGSYEHDWYPLSETRREVDRIHRFHERQFDVERLLLQEEMATEERLKAELQRFDVIHLATHGYFQPPELPSAWESAVASRGGSDGAVAGGVAGDLALEHRLVTGYLPGLLSGLVCSGANASSSLERDNGLLTAEEVAWLDLTRCDLVVLSACQTALGTSRAGEGMMSLRRAFHQAGARTVISSLWKVRDDSTRDLMLGFYDRLWNGEQGRFEALRGAQLEMLNRNRERYGEALPATWGAFVLSGDWR